MLTRTFTGSSGVDFAVACREVMAAAVDARLPARLLDVDGAVLFEVDARGRTSRRPAIVEETRSTEDSDDGWYRTEAALVVVHLDRIFSVAVDGVLRVAPLLRLPDGAQPIPEAELGALQLAAEELIEIYCQGAE
jgi:hypothetical protein